MKPLLAIIGLTWKAALRYRLFLAAACLLIGAVVALPLIIRDDGTARGFIQILLTYTLSVITILLGFATLWLSCGVLARDIEECQMQMVTVKPIARWQVWLGKWLGIISLNAALLTISGGAVYGLLIYRANQLPEDQQKILRNEVLVSRASHREPSVDIEQIVDATLESRLRGANTNDMNFTFTRQQLEAGVRSQYEVVPPNNLRRWEIPFRLPSLTIASDEPIYLRMRFYGANTNVNTQQYCEMLVGNEEHFIQTDIVQLPANTFHEFPVVAGALGPDVTFNDMLNADGNLVVEFTNRDTNAVIFPMQDGFEILTREGGFALNYVRGLLIILFWLSLLAALGLAAASYMSFPVACFFTLSFLIVILSSGTVSSVVEEGTLFGHSHETGEANYRSMLDTLLLPLFKVMMTLINLVRGFSPVDYLSTGRSIGWLAVLRAFGQIVVLLGGILAAAGMFLFHRRELATAQNTQ